MKAKLIKEEKDLLEIETDNLTIAELIRKQLWKNKATIIAGWKQSHPTKPAVLTIKTKGDAKKVLKESIKEIQDELEKIKTAVKKAKED
ncbi:MAG: RpoL/Rpb11 RNA polymerase subunit family protein [Candidatus Pacearchaeota archaeon]